MFVVRGYVNLEFGTIEVPIKIPHMKNKQRKNKKQSASKSTAKKSDENDKSNGMNQAHESNPSSPDSSKINAEVTDNRDSLSSPSIKKLHEGLRNSAPQDLIVEVNEKLSQKLRSVKITSLASATSETFKRHPSLVEIQKEQLASINAQKFENISEDPENFCVDDHSSLYEIESDTVKQLYLMLRLSLKQRFTRI